MIKAKLKIFCEFKNDKWEARCEGPTGFFTKCSFGFGSSSEDAIADAVKRFFKPYEIVNKNNSASIGKKEKT